jgi:hypothetical protein
MKVPWTTLLLGSIEAEPTIGFQRRQPEPRGKGDLENGRKHEATVKVYPRTVGFVGPMEKKIFVKQEETSR